MSRIPTWLVFVIGATLCVGAMVYGFGFAFPHPDFLDEHPERAYRARNTVIGLTVSGLGLLIISSIMAVIRGDPKKNQKNEN